MVCAKSAKRLKPFRGLSQEFCSSSFLLVCGLVAASESSIWKLASVRCIGEDISASSPPKNLRSNNCLQPKKDHEKKTNN